MSDKKETTSLALIKEELKNSKKVDKAELEKYLDLSMEKYDLELTPEAANQFKRQIASTKHGLHAGVPLICMGGRKCPLGLVCPFTLKSEDGIPNYEGSIYPIGRLCPVEQEMVKLHILDLVEEYNIHPDDTTDMAIISRLAVLNVYEYRASVTLGKHEDDGGGLIIEEVGTVDPKSGREFYTKRIHPAFELQEKIHKQRQDLLKSMVATRREKYKAIAATGKEVAKTNLAKSMQDILSKISQAQSLEAESNADASIIEAEFTVATDTKE